MDVNAIKKLLHTYGVSPLKFLGQNFLVNERALEKIASVANLGKRDTVVEIGPGLGVLTEKLASAAKDVIAVEIDKKFIRILEERFAETPNVRIIHQDILQFSPPSSGSYAVAGNLPYNIAGDILEKFLQKEPKKPNVMVITVQKEFAEKMAAKPPLMTRLGLFVQYYGVPHIEAEFPPSYFWPQPNVRSSLVEIKVKKRRELPLSIKQENIMWQMIKTAFNQPRKTLKNSLGFTDSTFQQKRPQELALSDWMTLAAAAAKK